MFDEEHCHAVLLRKFADDQINFIDFRAGQTRGWFVQQNDFWLPQQQAREHEFAALKSLKGTCGCVQWGAHAHKLIGPFESQT